jgi:PAS domain S-box-containing protein
VIRYINGKAQLLFGYDARDVVGQPVETLLPESSQHVHAAHRSGFVDRHETRFMGSGLELSGRRRDDSHFPAEVVLSLIDTKDDPLVVAAVYDVTDRANDNMAALVESANDPILSTTLDGVVTSWNEAAAKMYGCARQQVIGKSIMLLEPTERAEEIADILVQVAAGRAVEDYQSLRRRDDGTEVLVALAISPMKDADGVVIGASAIARGVTAQRLGTGSGV